MLAWFFFSFQMRISNTHSGSLRVAARAYAGVWMTGSRRAIPSTWEKWKVAFRVAVKFLHSKVVWRTGDTEFGNFHCTCRGSRSKINKASSQKFGWGCSLNVLGSLQQIRNFFHFWVLQKWKLGNCTFGCSTRELPSWSPVTWAILDSDFFLKMHITRALWSLLIFRRETNFFHSCWSPFWWKKMRFCRKCSLPGFGHFRKGPQWSDHLLYFAWLAQKYLFHSGIGDRGCSWWKKFKNADHGLQQNSWQF